MSSSSLASLDERGSSHLCGGDVFRSPRSDLARELTRALEALSWYGGGWLSLAEEFFFILWMLPSDLVIQRDRGGVIRYRRRDVSDTRWVDLRVRLTSKL